MQHKKITFIGAGNMAASITSGLIKHGYPAELICLSAPSKNNTERLQKHYGIISSQNNSEAVNWADIVVLAVKPQKMAEVCQAMIQQGADFGDKLVISIAAGVSISRLQSLLGENTKVIRTMPNTPSLLQKGMTGLFATSEVDFDDKNFASDLMSAVGEIVWVKEEGLINAITATSGSAPAYFFLFMEAMQAQAIEFGFAPEEARTLVLQTALGSVEMVKQNPDIDLSTLRKNVTSKDGTTAKALDTFDALQLSDIVAQAMQAAAARGEEMEKLF